MRVSQCFINVEALTTAILVGSMVIFPLFWGQGTETQKSNPCTSWWQNLEYKALVSFSLQNSTTEKHYKIPILGHMWLNCPKLHGWCHKDKIWAAITVFKVHCFNTIKNRYFNTIFFLLGSNSLYIFIRDFDFFVNGLLQFQTSFMTGK